MSNRILLFLLVFCAFSISLNAQQYGKIIDYFDAKEVLSQEKKDLNMKTFIPIKSNGATSVKASFISESFDTEIPSTWTINNTGTGSYPGWLWADEWTENPISMIGHAVIDSDANGAGMNTVGELTTPTFDCSAAAGLKLECDIVYNDLSSSADFFKIDVWNGTGWVNILNYDEDHGLAGGAETISIDITAHANTECKVRFTYDDTGKWGWFAAIDNVNIFEPDPYDLRALSLIGSPYATEGQEKTFDILIENIGSQTVQGTDYTIVLQDTLGTILGTTAGVDIAPTTVYTATISFTPAAADTIAIQAAINFADDSNLSNNETETMELAIQNEGTFITQVGTDETLFGIPFNFYYKNSASQTIYTPSQLGIGGGTIEAISYENNFATDLSAGKPVKIWIGETTETDLSDGWIDPSTLTLVYDESIELPSGRNIISIPLQTPYVYNGGNLVIYTYRVFEDQYHAAGDKFYATAIPESKCTRQKSSDTEFSDDLSTVEGTAIDLTPNTVLFFSTEGLGALTGTITSEGTPVEGVTVKIVDSYANAMTNTDGEYNFPYVVPGNYELSLEKFGYEPSTIIGVTINEDETTNIDGIIDPISTYTVTGTIISSDLLTGIEGAEVSLEGYDNYSATTDASGMFTIDGVYGGGRDYLVTASYEGYSTYTSTVTIDNADLSDINIILEEIPYPAVNVTAEINSSDEAEIVWRAPGSLISAEFRYDNDVQTGQLGAQSGTDKTVIGSVHRVNAQITDVSWYTTAEGGPHATMNVFIFDLNGSGLPTNNILYTATVNNTDLSWTTHTLPTPVDAPNGFMIAVSYAGFTGIGTTTPDEDYPYTDNTHYVNIDYTTEDFATIESIGDPSLEKPIMVRAYGYDMGKTKTQPTFALTKAGIVNHDLKLLTNEPVVTNAPTFDVAKSAKAFIDYTIYRLKEGQDMADWDEIGTNVTDTSFIDTDWTNLDFGLYQYAVVSNYSNTVTSDAVLSNVLPKDMTVEYTVSITTNISQDATGAIVTLTNVDGDAEHVYELTANATGAVFDSVWRGIYNITITKEGFNTYTAEGLDINDLGLSTSAELIETIKNPYGLVVTQENYDANFSWNNSLGFTDDFESYNDFALDFAPWTLVDADGLATYVFQGIQFPNGGEPMAGIIFNPSAVSDQLPPAYSGDKFVAVFNPADQSACDDWIISPKTQIMPNGQVSFMARGGHANYSAEVFQVFVSTTDTNPGSFTAISSTVTCPSGSTDWVEYTYSLDAYAGQEVYVALHITSADQFYFCLDDFSIGEAKGSKAVLGYNVYFNGSDTPINTTLLTETSYVFEDLAIGTYTAGVEAVFESGNSDIVEIQFEIVEPTYEVTFNVTGEAGPLANATVTVGTEEVTTNASGSATLMLTNGDYSYTAAHSAFISDTTGNFTVNSQATTVDISIGVGIDGITTEAFSIYPNPTEGLFHIKTQTAGTVTILNAVGQVVMVEKINGNATINMSNNDAGVYIIRLQSGDNVNTKRIIIE